MNTQPEYFGDKPPAGGQPVRCACGNLATHHARYIVDDGSVGRWHDEPVCEKCGADRVISPDPPPQHRAAPRLVRPRSPHPTMAARRRSQSNSRRAAVMGHLT